MIVMEMGLPQARIRGSVASNGHSDTVAMRKQCAQRVCSTHLTTLCSSPLYPSARGACRQPAHRQVHAAAGFFALRMLLVAGAESPELGELLRQLSAMILTSDHGPLWLCPPLLSSQPPFPTLGTPSKVTGAAARVVLTTTGAGRADPTLGAAQGAIDNVLKDGMAASQQLS